jgi:hypothetical protein
MEGTIFKKSKKEEEKNLSLPTPQKAKYKIEKLEYLVTLKVHEKTKKMQQEKFIFLGQGRVFLAPYRIFKT